MKRFFSLVSIGLASVSVFMLTPFLTSAQDSGPVKVAATVICKNVADREPVDSGTRFSVAVGKLYCFSKITEIQNASNIVHVWYFGDTERARVTLNVKPPAWRTYSSKTIQTHEIGAWRVEVHDASGNLLETVGFETTQ